MPNIVFDIQSGIAGDMIVAAALDLGVPEKELLSGLKKTGLDFSVSVSRITRSGISAVSFQVQYPEQKKHRHLNQILEIIEKSALDPAVKERAGMIFRKLAAAEAKVHRTDVENVHFHEVGAVDAIVDIVGASLAFHLLGVDAWYVTPFTFGSGTVRCEHGLLGVPVPATVELTRGFPGRRLDVQGELVTPTGAAIATALSRPVSDLGDYTATAAGYGAGRREIPGMPNVLRLLLCEPSDGVAERVMEIQTNVDDVPGEIVGRAVEALFEAGALDVFTLPAGMKKSRPGVLITVIARPDDLEKLSAVLLSETGSIGFRYCEKRRQCLAREAGVAATPWGEVRTKVVVLAGEKRVTPEYESCRELAKKAGIPVRRIYDAVRKTV